ncbi:unnamed protein product [Protopolystoma xenopodis]|uniref:Uncharacterized protein n=1 Tax=Protopolystoma xenopodis TaxID=117903 RepID=A0A448X0W2_9PLAT|nr:unnamed protein product [Protopolystoma xenopodis]
MSDPSASPRGAGDLRADSGIFPTGCELAKWGCKKAYMEHGFRMLCIWFHGQEVVETLPEDLHQALSAIGRIRLAERVLRELRSPDIRQKNCVIS